jgi:hypothetical protein
MIAPCIKKSLPIHDLNADLGQQRFDDAPINALLTHPDSSWLYCRDGS